MRGDFIGRSLGVGMWWSPTTIPSRPKSTGIDPEDEGRLFEWEWGENHDGEHEEEDEHEEGDEEEGSDEEAADPPIRRQARGG